MIFRISFILVTSLDQADREQGPVGKGDALAGLAGRLKIIGWPKGTKVLAASWRGRNLALFRGTILRRVGNIGTDGHVVDSKVLGHVVDMVKEHVDRAAATQETGNAADTDVATGSRRSLE